MNFSLKIAWAYFKRAFSGSTLGIMVIISILGIALGVSSLVITLSVMNGFHREITSKLLSLNPHIIIMDPFGNDDIDVKSLLNEFHEVKNYNKFLYGKALLYAKKRSQGIVVKGVDLDNYALQLSAGDWSSHGNKGIVIGDGIAEMLGVGISDTIYLVVPKLENISAPMVPIVEKFKISGIFTSGIYEYDSTLAFIEFNTARKIYSDESIASGYELYINDPFSVDHTFKKLRAQSNFMIQTWKDKNQNLFAALKLEKLMMFIVLAMIVVVATFNIAGTLIMLSITRAKDCGIMRAIGATKNNIRWMFHLQGLIIAITGTTIGLLGGLILAFLLKKYQFIQLPPKVYLLSTLPVSVNMTDIFLIVATTLLICLASSFYPSIRAANIEIAAELRNE